MDESIAAIEKMVKSLTSREREKLIIDDDLSEVLGFDVSGDEPDLDELVDALDEMGLEVDQEKFKQLASSFESAEGLSRYLLDNQILNIDPYSHATDDLFDVLIDLWEYWIPERPSMEQLEDYIRLGYKFLQEDEKYKCCIAWLAAFPRVWEIMVKRHQKKTEDPFEAFKVTFFNWIQDVETELWNLGLSDPFFHAQRIAITEGYLQCCPDLDSLITENMQSALAETYFHIGERDKANTLFENWLKKDPTWGWGWIHWSDCYFFGSHRSLDRAKAEEILKRGLAQKNVREKKYLLDRLKSIYEEIN